MPSMKLLPSVMQWLLLLVLSVAAATLLELVQLPAAALIGSMVAGIVIGINAGAISVPPAGFAAAQAVIGCVIAASLSPAIFPVFLQNWMLFLGTVVVTVAASSLLGWVISYWKILPGTVGVWGSSPGASNAMVLMAGAFGADQRLVAFMQYLRIVMVSIGSTLIARLWVDTSSFEPPSTNWFPAIEPSAFALTLAVIGFGSGAGRLIRLPIPYFLGPFILGAVVHLAFGLDFQLPHWLVTISFAVIGWTIGLEFRRETLRHATRSLPQMILAILVLMAVCGGIAFLLVHEMGIDPLTAYLATSPGGMETVAIIAAASDTADISFIMTMQALRFLLVLLAGPPLARLIAGFVKP